MALRDQLSVMVVDDMSTSRGLIAQSLDAFGIRSVGSCSDAQTALINIEKKPVHLIISDYNMPGMDGLEFLRVLRANPQTNAVGFILITGRADQAVFEKGKKLGMNNILRKPFQPSELKICIEAVVGRL